MPDARRIVESLGGRWSGRGGVCFCPAHQNTRTPALSVTEADDGRLLLHCHAGCEFADILAALRFRGLEGGDFRPPEPAQIERRRREDELARMGKAAKAKAIWEAAQPIAGTLAETYLRHRDIRIAIPDTLRFHPRLWHRNSETYQPGMVARVDGGDGFAIHRTFLHPSGRGKTSSDPAKMMLGEVLGGGVRVATGEGPLVVAEGIETALSIAELLPDHGPVWATLSTSGMRMFRLPPWGGRLVLAIDADEAGISAGNALGERARDAGWTITVAKPDRDGDDWNAVLSRARNRKSA